MEINLECSEIINEDYSQFLDANSQIYLNEESFVVTPSHASAFGSVVIPLVIQSLPEPLNAKNSQVETVVSIPEPEQVEEKKIQVEKLQVLEVQAAVESNVPVKSNWEKVQITRRRNTNVLTVQDNSNSQLQNQKNSSNTMAKKIMDFNSRLQQPQPDQLMCAGDIQPTFRMVADPLPEPSKVSQPEQKPQNKLQIRKMKSGIVEPVPVFDCVFCCQEHFVLFKYNEMALINNYANSKKQTQGINELAKATLLMNIQNRATIKGEERDIDELVVEAEEKSNQSKLGDQNSGNKVMGLEESRSIIMNGYAEMEELGVNKPVLMRNVEKFAKKKLKEAAYLNEQKQALLMQQSNNKYKTQQSQPVQVLDYQQHKKQAQMLQQSLLLQELVGTTMDDGNHWCVNPRERRRQALLRKISFESEAFNIYDPSFTSEEEMDSIENDQDSLTREGKKKKQQKKKKQDSSEDDNSEWSEFEDEEEDEEEGSNEFEEEEGFSEEGSHEMRGLNSSGDQSECKTDDFQFLNDQRKMAHTEVEALATESLGEEMNMENQGEDLDDGSSLSSIQKQENFQDGFNESSSDEAPPPIEHSPQSHPSISPHSPPSHQDYEDRFIPVQVHQAKVKLANRQHLKGISGLAVPHNDEESERLTFGCATPPQDDNKVTFSHCGDNSLSPVRTQKSYTQQKMDDYDDLSTSNKKKQVLLGHSPISQQEITTHNIINQLQMNDQSDVRMGEGLGGVTGNQTYAQEFNYQSDLRSGFSQNNNTQPFGASYEGMYVVDQTEENGLSDLVSQQRLLLDFTKQNHPLLNNFCDPDQYPHHPERFPLTQPDGESLGYIQQKSYDTDMRVMGNILSQMSKPTEDSKEEEFQEYNNETQDYQHFQADEMAQIVLKNQRMKKTGGNKQGEFQQAAFQSQSHSFNGYGQKHQKLMITDKLNKMNMLQNGAPMSVQNSESASQVQSIKKMLSNPNAESNFYLQKVSQQLLNKKQFANFKNLKGPLSSEEYQFDMKKVSLDQMIRHKHESTSQQDCLDQLSKLAQNQNKQASQKKKSQIGGGIGSRVQTEGMCTPLEYEGLIGRGEKAKTNSKKNHTLVEKEDEEGGLVVVSSRIAACSTNRSKQIKPSPSDFSQLLDYQKQQKKLQTYQLAHHNQTVMNQYSLLSGSKSVQSKSNDLTSKPLYSYPADQNMEAPPSKTGQSFLSQIVPKILITSSEFPLAKNNNLLIPHHQQAHLSTNQKAVKLSQRDLNFRSALCSNRYSTTSDNQALMNAIQSASIDGRKEQESSNKRVKTGKRQDSKSKKQHKRDASKISSYPSKKSSKKSNQKLKKQKNSSNQRQKSITKSNILEGLTCPTQTTIQYGQLFSNNENKSLNAKSKHETSVEGGTIRKTQQQKNKQILNPTHHNGYMSIQESKTTLYPNEQVSTISSCNHYTNNSRKANYSNLNGSTEEQKMSYLCFLDHKPQLVLNNTNINGLNNHKKNSICVGSIYNQVTQPDGKISQRGSISQQRQMNPSQNNVFANMSGCLAGDSVSICEKNGDSKSSRLMKQMGSIDPQVQNSSSSNGQFSFSQSSLKLNLTSNLSKPSKTQAKKKKANKTQMSNHIQINSTSSSSTLQNNSANAKKKNSQRTRSTSKQSSRQQPAGVTQSKAKVTQPTHQLLLTQQIGQHQMMLLKNQQTFTGQQAQPIIQKQSKDKNNKLKKILMMNQDMRKLECEPNLVPAPSHQQPSRVHQPKLGNSNKISSQKIKNQDNSDKINEIFKAFQLTGSTSITPQNIYHLEGKNEMNLAAYQYTTQQKQLKPDPSALSQTNHNRGGVNNSSNGGMSMLSQMSNGSMLLGGGMGTKEQTNNLKKILANEILNGQMHSQSIKSTQQQQAQKMGTGPVLKVDGIHRYNQ